MRQRSIIRLLGLLLAGVLAACSVQGEGAETTSGPDTTAPSTESTTSTTSTTELDTPADTTEPTTTTTESSTTTPRNGGSGTGTIGDPWPIGSTQTVGDWQVTLVDVDMDATDDLMAGSPDPVPPSFDRYVRITTDLQFTGSDTSFPGADVLVAIETSSEYHADYSCTLTTERDKFDAPDLAPGEQTTIDWCLDIPASIEHPALIVMEDLITGEASYWAVP